MSFPDFVETARCSGDCCRSFTLPVSPMELAFGLKKIARGIKTGWTDFEQIANMVIFLRNGTSEHGDRQWHYTCKNLDRATGNCTVYETRPKMCKDYPYRATLLKKDGDGACATYRGCTMRGYCVEPKMEKKMPEKSEEKLEVSA